MDDSESELSSLPTGYGSPDDEKPRNPSPTAKKKPTAQRNRHPYLPAPRSCTYSVHSLYDMIKDETVDLNPDYQRDVVWNDLKQSNLIDSIMHNYYIPPVVFATKHSEDGDITRICIDGKQRLTSMQRFMDGEIPYKDSINGRKAWQTSSPGSRRKTISEIEQRRFKNAQITCVEYENITEDQEREIFQRVQMGVSLTCAERLAAINGPHARIVRDLQAYLDSQGFNDIIKWSRAPNKDFQTVAQIVLLIGLAESKKELKAKLDLSTTRLNTFLSRKTLITDRIEETSQSVFETFCSIVKDKEWRSLVVGTHERFTPMEFVMATYLIFLYRSTFSYGQLAEAIQQLRHFFTQKFKGDKRFNTQALNQCINFLENKVSKFQYEYGVDDPPAYEGKPLHAVRGKRKLAAAKEVDTESISNVTVKRVRRAAASAAIPRQKKADVVEVSSSEDEPIITTKSPRRLPSSAARAVKRADGNAPSLARTTVKRLPSKTALPASAPNGATQPSTKKPYSSVPATVPQTQTARPSRRPSPSLKTSAHPKPPQPDSKSQVKPVPDKSRPPSISSFSTNATAPPFKSEYGTGMQVQTASQLQSYEQHYSGDMSPTADTRDTPVNCSLRTATWGSTSAASSSSTQTNLKKLPSFKKNTPKASDMTQQSAGTTQLPLSANANPAAPHGHPMPGYTPGYPPPSVPMVAQAMQNPNAVYGGASQQSPQWDDRGFGPPMPPYFSNGQYYAQQTAIQNGLWPASGGPNSGGPQRRRAD